MRISQIWKKHPVVVIILLPCRLFFIGAKIVSICQPIAIFIIGVDGISDALQAVKDGRLSASVLQDANGQASAVIDVAVKVGVGEEVESRYNVPFQLITADNVDDYLE